MPCQYNSVEKFDSPEVLHFKNNIQRYVQLTEGDFGQIVKKLKTVSLKRREILVPIGDVCKHVYFIESGLLRYYQIVDGEEVTGQFFFEGSWYTDLESFLTEKPSRQCAQGIEETKLLALSRKDLYQLFEEIPKFERFGRLMAENSFIGLRKKMDRLSLFTAEEAYLDLIKTRPKVIERVPQHYIASFLGIKPQSLSRIRKRLVS